MIVVYICDYICMLIGCFGGGLLFVWVDDFGVVLLWVLVEWNFDLNLLDIDEVIFGCVN